jgi:hypothetical protein
MSMLRPVVGLAALSLDGPGAELEISGRREGEEMDGRLLSDIGASWSICAFSIGGASDGVRDIGPLCSVGFRALFLRTPAPCSSNSIST